MSWYTDGNGAMFRLPGGNHGFEIRVPDELAEKKFTQFAARRDDDYLRAELVPTASSIQPDDTGRICLQGTDGGRTFIDARYIHMALKCYEGAYFVFGKERAACGCRTVVAIVSNERVGLIMPVCPHRSSHPEERVLNDGL